MPILKIEPDALLVNRGKRVSQCLKSSNERLSCKVITTIEGLEQPYYDQFANKGSNKKF